MDRLLDMSWDFHLVRHKHSHVIGPATHRESTQLTHTQHDSRSRKEWGRLLKTIPKEDFAKAFVRWQERCEKCIRIGGSYVEKS